jgi:putative Mg2+ transporter-C (MgtC) family protein
VDILPDLSYVSFEESAIRLTLAALAGMLMGIERELRDKPFGIRTFMIVSLGSAAFALMGMELTFTINETTDIASADPSRIIQGLIGGIGFLGAGAIFRHDDQVSGSTTGAGIWLSGAVGMSIGFGYYGHAIIILALMMVILILMTRLKKLF